MRFNGDDDLPDDKVKQSVVHVSEWPVQLDWKNVDELDKAAIGLGNVTLVSAQVALAQAGGLRDIVMRARGLSRVVVYARAHHKAAVVPHAVVY